MEAKMQISSIHSAKTHLSELIKKVQEGEDVVICKAGRPVVRLVKYTIPISSRKPGLWKGKIKIADDFDELPPKLLADFYSE
jgi:prevent-host-death family protein